MTTVGRSGISQVSISPHISEICDNYYTPTIKDHELQFREEETEVQYVISGKNKHPTDLSKLLRSKDFRQKFMEFLFEY